MVKPMRIFGTCLILSLLACGRENEEEFSFDNRGSLCVRATANGALVVRAIAPTCLSSSCSRVKQATCTVEYDGTQVIVQSTLRVMETSGVCTDDCGALTAECNLSTLSAGEYSIRYGDSVGTLQVPTTRTVLFDTGFGSSFCQDF